MEANEHSTQDLVREFRSYFERHEALARQVRNYYDAAGALVDSVAMSAPIEDWLAAQAKLVDRLAGRDGDRVAQESWEALRLTARTVSGVNHGQLHPEVRTQVLGMLVEQHARLTLAPRDPFAAVMAASGGGWS